MADDKNPVADSTPKGVAQLRRIIAEAPALLGAISETVAGAKPSPDAWSPKEELGHLIDSAANNDRRLIIAQLQEDPRLESYDGDGWVRTHSYQSRPWQEAVNSWVVFNQQLLATAEAVPTLAWSRTLSIGDSGPLTLAFVIDDYVAHMNDHLKHIGIGADPEKQETYPEKPAPADHEIASWIGRRWSPVAFDSRPVEREKILTLLEAARWAPSCFNDQPARYLVFDGSDSEALEKARACLVEGNAYARKAPVLLISVAHEDFRSNGKPNRWGEHDTGSASENLVLQAAASGLVAHQMAGFDAERARSEFGVPDRFTPMAAIAIGYPYRGNLDELPEKLRDRELKPRSRRPIPEIAFAGKWDVPYQD
ncbi:MAG: nitroreductase family protein [Blastocatellia bacterium]